MIQYIQLRVHKSIKDYSTLIIIFALWLCAINEISRIPMQVNALFGLIGLITVFAYVSYKLLSLSYYITMKKYEREIISEMF